MRTAALLWILAALAASACEGSGSAGDGGTDADTDTDADTEADGGDAFGAIELTGNWDGAQPDGVTFKAVVFECPFNMPPEYFDFDGTIDADTGDVHAMFEEVDPGSWCLMAYIDMNPDDGLMPVDGTDAVSATGEENESGALEVDVAAGETTVVDLIFQI